MLTLISNSLPSQYSHTCPWGLNRDGHLTEFIYPCLKYREKPTPPVKRPWALFRGKTVAAASKQAGGITFLDRDGNILTDDDEDEAEEDEPILVADDVPTTDENYNMNTPNNYEEIIHEQQEDDTITGVQEREQSDSTNDDNTQEHDPENTHDNTQTTQEEEKMNQTNM